MISFSYQELNSLVRLVNSLVRWFNGKNTLEVHSVQVFAVHTNSKKIRLNPTIQSINSIHYLTSEHTGYWFDWWTRWFSVRSILRNLLQENFEKRRPVNNDLWTFSRVLPTPAFHWVFFSTLTWHGPCTSLARDSRMMKSQWNRTIFLRANEIAPFSRDFPRERETLKKHCNLWLRWRQQEKKLTIFWDMSRNAR